MSRPTRSTLAVPVLAAFVVAVAACGGASGADSSQSVEVAATDALAFEPSRITATAGELEVRLRAGEGVDHTFAIDGANAGQPIVSASAGETATGTVSLEPGTYTFYCSVPGHRQAGMEGTLTVS